MLPTSSPAAPSHRWTSSIVGGLAWLACVVFTARWLWPAPGTPDVDIWLDWVRATTASGPIDGYRTIAADYPPGASLLLWIATSLGDRAGLDPRVSLKSLLFVCLAVTTGLTFAGARRWLIAWLVYVSLATSALGLMYLDILVAPFVAGAIWAGYARLPILTCGLLIAASLIKWQPLILLPFAAAFVWKQTRTWSQVPWPRVAVTLVPVAIAAAVYGTEVGESLYRASRHTTLSSFAANFPWLLTWWFERGSPSRLQTGGVIDIIYASRLTLRILSLAMLLVYGWVLRVYWKRASGSPTDWLLFSMLAYWSYTVISAGAHENHLFLASLLALGTAWHDRRRWPIAVALSALANLNLIVFYGWTGYTNRLVINGLDVSVVLAVANCAGFAFIAFRAIRAPARALPTTTG